MTDQPLVAVRNVEKTYGTFQRILALRGVNLDVGHGERVAILGPNGAGKSTLLRLVLGVMRPTRGTVRWSNGVPLPIGFAPERPRLLPRTTVSEYLDLAPARCGDAEERIASCVDALQLEAVLHRRTEGLSKGEAQRVSLAYAFLTDAPVVVLDEPFEGLDPMIRPLARGFILSSLAASATRTLITTTHRLEEVREPFERVLVINNGQVVKDVTLGELRGIAAGTFLVLPAGASTEDIRASVLARGLSTTSTRTVRGTYGDVQAVLVGPFPSDTQGCGENMHPLDLETLLQLWLQPELL